MRISLCGTLFLLLSFLFVADAQVETTPEGDQYHVQMDGYKAFVEPDGCLTSLEIAGEEFLNKSYGISRGAYFYQAGPLKLEQIKLDRKQRILTAQNDRAEIEYRFEPYAMTWTVKNLTSENMSFFIIFDASLDAVMNRDGDMFRLAVNEDWSHSVWFLGAGRLEIDGSTKLWDWGGSGNNVWEVLLEGGKEHAIRMKMGAPSREESAKIKELPPLLGEGGEKEITVLSPKPYQVFQRRTREAGPVLISGRVKEACDAVEAQITGPGLEGGWFALERDAATRSFNHRMRLDAGGWYRLDLRVKKSGKATAAASVEKFGVGEVFVAAGQSNSTNSGQFRTKQDSGMVSAFNGWAWRPGDDPYWGTHDMSQGGSPWTAFGDALFEQYKVPIGVAVTGHGGTSVNQWQPGRYQTPLQVSSSELFHWMMVRIHQLGPQGFRAVLWHQGESDCKGETTESYVEKMARVIRASKEVAGWEFPWFVAQVSYHYPDNPRHDNIRDAHARLWAEGIALEGPDTDTLTGKDRDYDGRGIHFSPQGLKKHGRMWAEKVIPWLDEQLER